MCSKWILGTVMIKMIGNLFNTDERNFNVLGNTQCGNLGIFPLRKFYTKSILAYLESQLSEKSQR